MSEVPYSPLSEISSTPRGSIITLDSVNTLQHLGIEHPNHLCRICKNRLIRKQELDHTPFECLNERCETLESEAVKWKDRDMKSRIQIKELESKVSLLEEIIAGLTSPKQQQAAPFSFNSGQKLRNPFKKAQSIDVSVAPNPEINFDNILPPSRRNSRERVGLFGSLGASSQFR